MDYEKLYKEALERASKYYNANTNKGYREIFEDIFHEFKESEDERIRKEIYRYFRDLQLSSDREFSPSISVDEILAWLEKQDIKLQEYIDEERNKKDFYCEGKEMSWNEIPLDVRKHDYPYYFKGDLDCYPFNVEKQGKQKPIEWSEEDEEMHKEVLTDLIYAKNDLKTKGCLELSNRAMKAFNWFSKRHKSLRPQSKWKPSEEQLNEVKKAIRVTGTNGTVLLSLYNDLKNL